MIVFKVILAIIILYAGKMTWQLFKRGSFLKKISNSQAEMAAFISIETLDAFSQKNPVYVNKGPGGYVGNISLIIDIDLTTQRRLKLLFGSITVLALTVSAYVGSVLFLINLSLFLLTASTRLPKQAGAMHVTIDYSRSHFIQMAARRPKGVR